MSQSGVAPGQVVRYDETTNRWFIGTVRRVDSDRVELEYLDGYREVVPPSKLTPLVDYLKERDRSLSLTREDLCYVLYRQTLERVRLDRLAEMQRFLRGSGVRFSPKDWTPGARIRLSYDDSVIRRSDVDRDFESLLPHWTEPLRLPEGSRDPLGFQAFAERIADEFLPGLTVFTNRIAYYGLCAWAARELNNLQCPRDTSRREQFHRVERAFALCEFINHGVEDDSCKLLGQRSRSEVLQSAHRERFRVPQRILKNQESTGALRIYSTSMESHGFAKMVPERAVENLIPLELTELGVRLAREFGRWIPEGFLEFALSDGSKDRDSLRTWGKRFCLSEFGRRAQFRDAYLEGFLLGDSREAEARYRTVKLLRRHRLLRAEAGGRRKPARPQAVTEEDALRLEDAAELATLGNDDVLLRFYELDWSEATASLQRAAVFEVLSLAHTAIFSHALRMLDQSGRVPFSAVRDSIVDVRGSRLWSEPLNRAGRRASSVRELEERLFEAEGSAARAVIGGLLLARIQADPPLQQAAEHLRSTPALRLLQGLSTAESLSTSLPSLLEAMAQRHSEVSAAKNRQRWCYQDGASLVADDRHDVSIGWHAMRFPQLQRLCHDVSLESEDLEDAA